MIYQLLFFVKKILINNDYKKTYINFSISCVNKQLINNLQSKLNFGKYEENFNLILLLKKMKTLKIIKKIL